MLETHWVGLVPPFWRPGPLAPWKQLGGPVGQPKGRFGVRSRIFMDLVISGPPFESSTNTLEQTWCFFLLRAHVLFFKSIFSFESGRTELGIQAFCVRVCGNTNFSHMSGFC